jgi:diguanylate cyclase (GGDEF)-like protein
MENSILSMEREEGLPFAVIMGDLNGLKLVNDAFGHSAGDIFIIKVAEILRECSRKAIWSGAGRGRVPRADAWRNGGGRRAVY